MRIAAPCALAAAVLVSGCLVGPDYQRPPAPTPARFKEAADWKPGEPRDEVDRGDWWALYNDPLLDQLEREVDISNQNLMAAEAAYRQARAVVDEARAGLFPTVSLAGSGSWSGKGGGGRSATFTTTSTGAVITTSGGGGSNVSTSVNLAADAIWSVDLWGRIRRTIESDVATAQASAADLANVRLLAQTQLAALYFELRAADELKRLLEAAVVAFTQSLSITRNQYAAGIVGQADVVTAETLLEQTRAQAIAVGVQRAQFEHAIASLIGKPPAEFAIEPAPLAAAVPVEPPGLPSSLLERRPDIAGAERRMAAFNAQIGVAVAAFYPDLTLSASYGFAGSRLSKLLRAANSFWSVGPQLAETVFDAGLRAAQVEATKAAYDQTVAVYRQTVLTAFQQVEDELAALRILSQQADVQANAVRLAREAERLTLNQYQAGTVAYTAVLTAQTTALANEETEVNIKQSRLVASVTLIQALGGGWSATALPRDAQVESDDPPAANP